MRQPRPRLTATSSSSWTAMERMTPSIFPHSRRRSWPASTISSLARVPAANASLAAWLGIKLIAGWGAASRCDCFTGCATPTCAPSARSGAISCSRFGMREFTYGWNLEMQMRAARVHLRILEIPVPCRRRIGGVSKVSGNLSGSLKAGAGIATTLVRVAFNQATYYEAMRHRKVMMGINSWCRKRNSNSRPPHYE